MNVLAFDTCFGACSVALRYRTQRGEIVLREAYEERATGHAEALIPMMDGVVEGAGIAFADIDRIAVTEGPGTFTGVRIGVATARGLALALGKPIVAVSSLMLMALRVDHLLGGRPEKTRLAVCVDARKGQVYAQIFGENGGDALTGPELLTPEQVAARLAGRPAIAVGSGAAAVLAAGNGGQDIEAALPKLEPHARMMAIVAAGLPVRAKLSPLYLRPPDAKPQTLGAAAGAAASESHPASAGEA